ncbi:DNA-directed RNA polymerase sigma-70 factor [Kitasatospora phosalacinea]|uniref:DNA-directed RNA polymerase sigma-70 factor n=1 Tax=Kitasatospora phosalacinea TaxID=2065 RepID=A0A9W6V4H8_9ACTN|nr:RNA polymerase sigma factor [Kitasatospora phosalacinea]GLW72242.1 DNA-directed RNA polymerase sigma-70 factor [Kitasatospora phosalacinea]
MRVREHLHHGERPDDRPPELTTPDGFGAFYHQHVDAILGFVTRRVSDPHLAADLTADIFVAALEAAAGYRPERGTPLGWLYGIARHTVAARRRGDDRERRALGRLQGRRLLAEEDILALEERIDAERAVRDLAQRHAGLSAPLREVLDLVVLDGLSTAEAAQALGISQATVRVRMHRARRRLGAAREDARPAPPLHRTAPAEPMLEVTP